MKSIRRFFLVPALAAVLALGATACSGASTASTAQTAAATTRAPVAQGAHGFVKVAGEALGEVDLRPEQRAEIEKLAQAAEARHATVRAEVKALMLDVADQIEKGAVDRAALKPRLDQVIAKMDQVRPEDQASLVKLHDVLDDAQRAAFVDALRERGKQRMVGAHERGGGLFALGRDLGLTPEQGATIREAMRDGMRAMHGAGETEHAAGEAERGEHAGRGGHGWGGHHGGGGRAMLEAFKQPKFDPSTVGPQGTFAERAKGKQEAAFAVAEKVLPVLTAEQRKTLAEKIRARANAEDPAAGF
jgi:Spy/CpxP family protein refolding chaperone